MKAFPLLIALLVLSGCKLCEQHPIACTISGVIVVGSVAAVVEHHHDQMHDRQISPSRGPQCRNGSCAP